MQALLKSFHTRFVFSRRVRVLVEALVGLIPPNARVLDVGCGNGLIAAGIASRRPDISIRGIDVLVRPETFIEVTEFDGATIPFADETFDVVMFIDVLHHTEAPERLLSEATRVSTQYLLLKDHLRSGHLSEFILRVMDWTGNAHHQVVLPYNYLSAAEWQSMYRNLGLQTVQDLTRLRLYPWPADLIFGGKLHFISLLQKS